MDFLTQQGEKIVRQIERVILTYVHSGGGGLVAKLSDSCDPLNSKACQALLRPWDSPSKNTGVGCHALPCVK